jgi:p-aminobenzoyl-glutamate transporter AbgT
MKLIVIKGCLKTLMILIFLLLFWLLLLLYGVCSGEIKFLRDFNGSLEQMKNRCHGFGLLGIYEI